mmetsp:Transcript_125670/g.391322  ORF Transcript_125670/g.391322 Transcript_125670/m.391322 type:complete len:207 (+) Transcript_125670:197-817(+)
MYRLRAHVRSLFQQLRTDSVQRGPPLSLVLKTRLCLLLAPVRHARIRPIVGREGSSSPENFLDARVGQLVHRPLARRHEVGHAAKREGVGGGGRREAADEQLGGDPPRCPARKGLCPGLASPGDAHVAQLGARRFFGGLHEDVRRLDVRVHDGGVLPVQVAQPVDDAQQHHDQRLEVPSGVAPDEVVERGASDQLEDERRLVELRG